MEEVENKQEEQKKRSQRDYSLLLQKDFTAKGIKLGRDGLFSFLSAEHMLINLRKSYTKTTDSKNWLHEYPNLVKDLQVTEKEQLRVVNITYIDTKDKRLFEPDQ